MANFCPKCGQEIQTGMSACPKCGAAITGTQIQNIPDGDVTKAKLGFVNFVNTLSIIMLVIFGIGLIYVSYIDFILIRDYTSGFSYGIREFLAYFTEAHLEYYANLGTPILGVLCSLYLFMKSSMKKKIYKATGKID